MPNHHVSKAYLWGECVARARLEAALEEGVGNQSRHVAAWVGDRVHHAITGHEFTDPDMVLYDEITPNEREADRQVTCCVQLARSILNDEELEIEDTEVKMSVFVSKDDNLHLLEGTADIIAISKQTHARFLLDLKTSARKPVNVMIQIGLYKWLWDQTMEARDARPLDAVGVLWVPRHRAGSEREARLHLVRELDDLRDLEKVAKTSFRRMADNQLSYSPSLSGCAVCPAKETCVASPFTW